MEGWRIFWYSVRQVFGNLKTALKVSLIPYALVFASTKLITTHMQVEDLETGVFGGIDLYSIQRTAIVVVSTICSSAIHVGWIRFVLGGYQPGLLPRIPIRILWGYLWRIAILSIFWSYLDTGLQMLFLLAQYPSLGGPYDVPSIVSLGLMLGFWIPAIIVDYRISGIFTSAALGKPIWFKSAWTAMRGSTLPILMLAITMKAASLLLTYMVVRSYSTFSISLELLNAIFFAPGWVLMMVGISIRTTLYGHYIEKRPLV